jgi:hypothetical protein
VVKDNSDTYDLFANGLNQCYYPHDVFDLDFTDVLGEIVDIEGRKITVYLPVSDTLKDITISVAIAYGEDIEIMPCDIKQGYAVFETNVTSSFALVEPNFTKGATEEDMKNGKFSEPSNSLFSLDWWKNFFK